MAHVVGVLRGAKAIPALALLILILILVLARPVAAGAGQRCMPDGRGNIWCVSTDGPVGPSSPGVVTGVQVVSSTLECGPRRKAFDDAQYAVRAGCQNYWVWCPLRPGEQIDPTREIVIYTISDPATNEYLRTDLDCDVPAGSSLPGIAAIKAEITKRAPLPHATAAGHDYLVNPAIVFYLTSTAPDLTNVTIRRFNLAGHHFTAQLHLSTTIWTWGDTSSTTYTAANGDPLTGHPYTDNHPCQSLQICTGYISHPYTNTGHYTITAQAHWSGTFTLDTNTDNIPIPGDIYRTDNTGTHITIHQAHAILIPNPPP
jgi:hypothetical protein